MPAELQQPKPEYVMHQRELRDDVQLLKLHAGNDLQSWSVGALRKEAAAAGVDKDAIEDARDGDDPRGKLIALIMSEKQKAPAIDLGALQANLGAMSVGELRKRAAADGVDGDAVEDGASRLHLSLCSLSCPDPC